VRLLVDGGVDLNAVDKNGKTALMYPSKGGRLGVMWLLVNSGADMNIAN
jgi:ankyrin repeat protein